MILNVFKPVSSERERERQRLEELIGGIQSKCEKIQVRAKESQNDNEKPL
jgi:hypothetical protein